jgi:Kef-type K+ transport system membrane component KefB
MAELLSFFIILISGLVLSELFRRLHLPYVTALIVAGILIGPFFLNLIELDETVNFLGSIGVVFLMFIAGSEIKIKSLKAIEKDVFIFTVFNGLIPFAVGFMISSFFGYGIFTSIILGTTFVSSSIAVIIPSLESTDLIHTKVGKVIISSTVIEDVLSLLFFGLLLQSFTQKTQIPLPLYIPSLILIIVALKFIIPKLQKFYHYDKTGQDLFESKLRFLFVVLVATVVLFEFMGMHAMIAGFIIGILLGDSIEGKIEEKVRTVSYGFFIPIFFLSIGMQTDLSVFLSSEFLKLTLTIILGSMFSKLISGIIVGKILGFTKNEVLLIGFSTMPHLSTALAVAFAALEFNILKHEIITSLIILSIITTFVSPLIIRSIASRKKGY